MPRALLLVLDSVGCGAAPDAAHYGDSAANTLGHILEKCPQTAIPTLKKLGLGPILGSEEPGAAISAILSPQSVGKDTTSGHWELAGAILSQPFAVFESFPPELVGEIEGAAGVRFIGNVAASGTEILEKLGAQSVQSGQPILYTSADSVLQIAAHETHFGLKRLLQICEIARKTADKYQIGRVIARPFTGENGDWQRTSNRRDFSILPPPTVLDALQKNHISVIGIGKISDIFAGRGLSQSLPTKSNAAGMETIAAQWQKGAPGFYFANLVDFDTLFGHRRDLSGYAGALETFDAWLETFLPQIAPDDLIIITADHGNDPTMPGTDHTRENVPCLVIYGERRENLGHRAGFSDVAATLAAFFGLEWTVGNSLLDFEK